MPNSWGRSRSARRSKHTASWVIVSLGGVAAQLIDQVGFTRQPEYVFHHPLIRTVAYESQLKSEHVSHILAAVVVAPTTAATTRMT